MAMHLSEPAIIERGPYNVVGMYAIAKADEEPWGEAAAAFEKRRGEITNRVGDAMLAFLYRPHQDHREISESNRGCFMGFEVEDFDHVPEGMATTRFSGGRFVTMSCTGDTEMEAAMGVGEAVGKLEQWIKDHGHVHGDACFCFSHEGAPTPPHVQWVYINLAEK
jgi:hypothetical protein